MVNRSVVDGVEILRLEHGKAQALDLELTEALRAALAEAAAAPGPLVLTGTGSIFSAGVDLFRVVEGGRDYVERFLPALDDLFLELFVYPRPVVAAINGHAIAGGCILACACDYRLLADGRAKVGLPELNVGVAFPASAIEVLRSVAGGARLTELLYFGRTYDPAGALAYGLVDAVVEPDALMTRALEAARELGAHPAASFRLTKALLREPFADRIRAAARQRARLVDAWASPDTFAAVRAYLEKTLRR